MSARQHGVAIVMAMAVVVLAALAATAMMVSQSTWSRQVELTTGHAQAHRIIQTGLDWVRAVLSDDRRTSNVDTLDEPWALQLPPIPVENGSLAGHIEDQQGKFNLNNVIHDGKVDVVQLACLQRLLSTLKLSPALADALADWIDADTEPQPQAGAEDAYYLALPSPYVAGNQALTDLSELALVRGYDDDVRARLRPFVTALPRGTTINVNTASAEVLSAVLEGLTLDDARALVAKRERSYFRDVSAFTSQLPRGLAIPVENLSVSSDYFIATMLVSVGGAQARGSALLDRENAGWPAVVWRKTP